MTPVLHVEDDEDDVFFLSYAWQEAGVPNPLVPLKDGQQAIDYLAGQGAFADRVKFPLPCLIVLDLKLPGKSGFDVLRWIRQQPALASLRVVILSASDQDPDIARAQRLGVIDYVIKPSSPARLVEIVRQRKAIWFGGKEEGSNRR